MSEIEIGSIIARLKGDTGDFARQMQQATQLLQQVVTGLGHLNQSSAASNQSLTQLAGAFRSLAQAQQTQLLQNQQIVQSTSQLTQAFASVTQAIQQQTQAQTQAAQAAQVLARQHTQLLQSIQQTTQAQQQATQQTNAWGAALSQALSLGAALGFVTTLQGLARALKDFITESLSAFATFEAEIIKVGTLIQGFRGHGQDFDTMAKQVQAWAISSGKNTKDISAALFELIGDFGGVAQASTVMTQALRLAEGGQATVAVTSKALSTIMLGLGLDISRTAEAADVLARAAQINRGDLNEFAKAITPLLPALRESRLSFQTASAALAVLTTQGRSSSEAVTGLSQMLISILAPTARAEKTMKDLATALGLPRIEAKKFQDGTLDLIATLKQFDGMDLQVARRALGGNQQALLTLEALVLAHDQLAQKMKDMSVASGTLRHEQELNAGTISQAWNKAAEAFKAFEVNLGAVVAQNPAVADLMKTMTEGWGALNRDIEANKSQLGTLTTIFATFGKAAIGTIEEVGRLMLWLGGTVGMVAQAFRDLPSTVSNMLGGKSGAQLGGPGAKFLGESPTGPLSPDLAARVDAAAAEAALVSPARPAPTTTMKDLQAGIDAQKAAAKSARDAARDAAREARRAAREAEQEEEAARRDALANVLSTGKNYLKAIDDEIAANDKAIESLRRLAAQYGLSKPARDADVAAEAEASLAKSVHANEARELNQAIQDGAKMLEQVPGLLLKATSSWNAYVESQKAAAEQTAYNTKLQDALERLRAPREERVSVAMRQKAPGGATTEEQDALLEQIRTQERLNYVAGLFESLGNSIGQAWTGALTSVADGTKTVADAFRDMARSIMQSLAQLAAQEGWKALIRLGAGLITGALTTGLSPGESPYGSDLGGMTTSNETIGRLRDLQMAIPHAQGGWINRPTFAMLGENPANNPEVVMNRQQMQQFMASAGRAGPSAGGQATGGNIVVINYTDQNRSRAEQEAGNQRAQGHEVVMNVVMSDLQTGESSRILRSIRQQSR